MVFFFKVVFLLTHLSIFPKQVNCQKESKTAEYIILNNEVWMPRVGFGTAALRKDIFDTLILTALQSGFRLFDGAEADQWYDDERLGKALQNSNFSRKELFISTKILPKNFGPENTQKSFYNALNRFNTTYLDLVYLHFPFCFDQICSRKSDGSGDFDMEGDWKDALKVLKTLYEKGKIRAIGLSNFDVDLLLQAIQIFQPHVVQNWMDYFNLDLAVIDVCKQHQISYVAYSLLGTQWDYRPHRLKRKNPVLENPEIFSIVNSSNKTVLADLALRWGLSKGYGVIPRSNSVQHIKEIGKIIKELKEIEISLGDTENCEYDSLQLGINPEIAYKLDHLTAIGQ